MTHTLKLSDGTTTINLTTNTVSLLLDYEPRTPDITQQEAVSAIVDGGELTAATQRNVTESARVVLVGANGAAVQSTIASINRLFRQAEERQKRKAGAARVYVQVQMDSDSAEWRSEVLTGTLSLSDTVWDQWSNSKAEVTLTWTRRFYWEGAADSVAMWNTSGGSITSTTGEIYNHNNGTDEMNFVHIDDDQIVGDLPAPMILAIANSTGGAVGYNNIYVGHGTWLDTSFGYILQGEDNSVSGGTDTSAATASGGYYHAKTWTGATTLDNAKYALTITGANLVKANGGHFRIMARFHVSPNSTTYVQCGLYIFGGLYNVYNTPEVKLTGWQLQDLGVVQLPPSLTGLASMDDMELQIRARDTVSGSLSIDFIHLIPLDGWRHYNIIGTDFANYTDFFDDGIAGQLYTRESGVDYMPNIVARGNPILLWPGRDQRLYFLFDEDNGNSVIGRVSTLGITYRPRRLTI